MIAFQKANDAYKLEVGLKNEIKRKPENKKNNYTILILKLKYLKKTNQGERNE